MCVQENAIPLLLPLKVSPRQAFQSLFAVAFGWVGMAFPVFLSISGSSFTLYGPKVPDYNPLPLVWRWRQQHILLLLVAAAQCTAVSPA